MRNPNVCIICINVAFANAAALQNALDCNIVVEQAEAKGYGKLLTQDPINISNIPEADHYIFAGSGIMTRINVSALKGRKTVIISDSHYLQDMEEIDGIIEKENIEVFCMADLWKFCKFEKKMYIHPFLPLNIGIVKTQGLSICHSPYHKIKTNKKGSVQIQSAVDRLAKKYPLDYLLITDRTWLETIKIKSTAHFFVDQISKGNHYASMGYVGGIGKSGLEAMLLKCLTFCAGEKVDTEDVTAAPFVQVENSEDLYNKMVYYLENKEEANELAMEQYNWAKWNTDPEVVANRILRV